LASGLSDVYDLVCGISYSASGHGWNPSAVVSNLRGKSMIPFITIEAIVLEGCWIISRKLEIRSQRMSKVEKNSQCWSRLLSERIPVPYILHSRDRNTVIEEGAAERAELVLSTIFFPPVFVKISFC
jgi:hypothetical protein